MWTRVGTPYRTRIADPARPAVSGWSFGGHTPTGGIPADRFKAASAGAGAQTTLIFDVLATEPDRVLHTYLGRTLGGLGAVRGAFAYRLSTRVHAAASRWRERRRVPAEQSIQFFEAIRGIGKVPTELVIYPGQPHGVRSPRLQRDLMTRNVEWLRRWVLGAPQAS